MREYFKDGRIVVTGASFDKCQSETMQIMDDVANGTAAFTMPVRQADGNWVAIGRVYSFVDYQADVHHILQLH